MTHKMYAMNKNPVMAFIASHVNFPNALAQAMNFSKGEVVEWEVEDINTLKIVRTEKMTKRKGTKS